MFFTTVSVSTFARVCLLHLDCGELVHDALEVDVGGGHVAHRPPGEVQGVTELHRPAPSGGGVEADPEAAAVLARELLPLHVVQHGLPPMNNRND